MQEIIVIMCMTNWGKPEGVEPRGKMQCSPDVAMTGDGRACILEI